VRRPVTLTGILGTGRSPGAPDMFITFGVSAAIHKRRPPGRSVASMTKEFLTGHGNVAAI
jgi:hypothetical protein